MRNAFLILATLSSLSGCLFGAGRTQTTTTFVDDPGGDGPVHRQTYTTNASGLNVGGSVPLMAGPGGMMVAGGGAYGGAMIVGGGYAGGNTACILHPDRCAAIQVATVVQPISISSSGGGYANGNGASGGGTVVETDDSELTAMLAKHEHAISVIKGATKQNGRQVCQLIVGLAKKSFDDGDKTILLMIPDVDERKDVIVSCQEYLDKHPYAKTAQKEGK